MSDKIMKKIKRKLHLLGGYNLCVIIPQKMIKDNKLNWKHGDQIEIAVGPKKQSIIIKNVE